MSTAVIKIERNHLLKVTWYFK